MNRDKSKTFKIEHIDPKRSFIMDKEYKNKEIRK